MRSDCKVLTTFVVYSPTVMHSTTPEYARTIDTSTLGLSPCLCPSSPLLAAGCLLARACVHVCMCVVEMYVRHVVTHLRVPTWYCTT